MLDKRRPFLRSEPSTPRRAAFGWGWLALFVVFTAAATLLWTGIGADLLGRLQATYGGTAKWIWLAGVFIAAVIAPLMVPKSSSSGRLRAFQTSSIGVLVLAVLAAVALQRAELAETASRGARTALALFQTVPASAPAGAPVPDTSPTVVDDPEVRAVLVALLTGDNFKLDDVAAVPTGYTESMTRASARATAAALLSRDSTLLELAMAANAAIPSEMKELTPLKNQLDALAVKLPGMNDREALDAVLVAQAGVTRALLVGDPKETEPKMRAAIDHANQQAAAAQCQHRGEFVHCRVGKIVYVLEREDGRWRVDRPGGNDGIFPTPFLIPPPHGGKPIAKTGAKADGDELEQALYTTESFMRATWRIELKVNLDPSVADLLTDDAAFNFLDIAAFLMQMRLEKGVKPGSEYPADLKRFNQLTEDNYAAHGFRREMSEEEKQTYWLAEQDRLRCTSRDELRRLIEQWNQVVPVAPAGDSENTMVEAMVNPLTLNRALPGEFDVLAAGKDGGMSPTGQRVVLSGGKWKWWEPRRASRECRTGAPADRPPPR